jgi:phosphoglycerate dehydrogenase-like enzyme
MSERITVIAPPGFAPLSMLRGAGLDAFISDDVVQLREAVQNAEIVLVAPRLAARLRDVWSEQSPVRWIHTLAAGVDTLLFPELNASDVVVTNAKGVFDDALAEYVLAAMLHFAKELGAIRRNQAAHIWQPLTVQRLAGCTLGIVGYGSIGSAVARLGAAAGMRIIAARRRPEQFRGDPLIARGFAISELTLLMHEADYIVITTPLTDETRGLIGARELAAMQPHAVLINIARGPVLDENALLDALQSRDIRGAALDVFATEPLPESSALWDLENVLLSPHCADHTSDGHERSMRLFLDNLRRYRSGQPLRNVVDKTQRY